MKPNKADIAYDTAIWLFFSVVLGLLELWVGLLILAFNGDTVYYFRTLQGGSLVVFSSALSASSFGIYTLRVERRRYRWRSLVAISAGVLLLVGSLVIYMLIVNVPNHLFTATPGSNIRMWSYGIALAAVFYSLFTNIMVNLQGDVPR